MENNKIVPTPRDVLNGRGMGVQRHPGNVKYRKLVFVNKGLYAKCPRADKIKISKGIVAAIRQSGGRFLELNERHDVYFDIGDKKATEKTSQALREGQKDIRKEIYKKEDEKAALTSSTGSGETVPYSNVTLPTELETNGKELPKEDYFQYSLLVLEALYNSDRNLTAPPAVSTQALSQQPPPLPPPEPVQPNVFAPMYAAPPQVMPAQNQFSNTYFDTSSAAMAMALDQFPGVRMPIQTMPQSAQQQPDRRAQFGLGAQASSRTFRLTDMSMGSIYSIRQLVESSRHMATQSSDEGESMEKKGTVERGTMERGTMDRVTLDRGTMDRGTMDSILSVGTLQMIRQSELQLSQIDGMDFDDLTPLQGEIDDLFDRNTVADGDRISDMRFSDLSKDRFTDYQDRGRSTDSSSSTKNTSYSGNSLMTERPSGSISTSDSDMAQLLLGLASEPRCDNDVSHMQE